MNELSPRMPDGSTETHPGAWNQGSAVHTNTCHCAERSDEAIILPDEPSRPGPREIASSLRSSQ
jgi:hypothetical protein